MNSLTSKAKKLLYQLAQAEAQNFNALYVLPEHIILALLKQNNTLTHRFLKYYLWSSQQLIQYCQSNLPHFQGEPNSTAIPLHYRVEQMLYKANAQSKKDNKQHIHTIHLFLAASQESESLLSTYWETQKISFSLLESYYRHFLNDLNDHLPLDIKKMKLIENYAQDLTMQAQTKQLDPVVGVNHYIRALIQILLRKNKNNPLLLGEPGVGKTATVEKLAQLIHEGKVPEALKSVKLLCIDMASLLAGAKYRGDFEKRLKNLIEVGTQDKNIIFFIDEIHTIIGAGSGEGSLDASNILKPFLARGKLRCIGATTWQEYKRYFEKDAALNRRFAPLKIFPPNLSETYQIIKGLQQHWQKFHHVQFSQNSLKAIVHLSDRYLSGQMPDKAIDLMDQVASYKNSKMTYLPLDQKILKKQNLQKLKQNYIKVQNYEKAALVRDQIQELSEQLSMVKPKTKAHHIVVSDVQRVISESTQIPYLSFIKTHNLDLLKQHLNKQIWGQKLALEKIYQVMQRSELGLSCENQPVASFIFFGPLGSGKNFVAENLAKIFYGKNTALITLNMADYMEAHSISKLVGAPPGYVGYQQQGLLASKLKEQPYSVILLNNIEKAHPDILDLFLPILDKGWIESASGQRIDFTHTIIILSSSFQANNAWEKTTLGFQTTHLKNPLEWMPQALEKFLKPELIHRVDTLVPFVPFDQDGKNSLIENFLLKIKSDLKNRGWVVHIDEKVNFFLNQQAVDTQKGAEGIKQMVHQHLEPLFIAKLLKNTHQRYWELTVTDDLKVEANRSFPSAKKKVQQERQDRSGQDGFLKEHLGHLGHLVLVEKKFSPALSKTSQIQNLKTPKKSNPRVKVQQKGK